MSNPGNGLSSYGGIRESVVKVFDHPEKRTKPKLKKARGKAQLYPTMLHGPVDSGGDGIAFGARPWSMIQKLPNPRARHPSESRILWTRIRFSGWFQELTRRLGSLASYPGSPLEIYRLTRKILVSGKTPLGFSVRKFCVVKSMLMACPLQAPCRIR